MKSKKNLILAVLAVVMISTSRADDINAILQQINTENSGGQNTSLKQNDDSAPVPKRKKRVSHTESQSVVSSTAAVPQIRIWKPSDKLPNDIAGQGVAGDFAVMGEAREGGAILVPGDGGLNPFARQFIVTNLSSGMAPGTIVPVYWRKHVQVSTDRPLIFIGRGVMPGTYMVQEQ